LSSRIPKVEEFDLPLRQAQCLRKLRRLLLKSEQNLDPPQADATEAY